MPLISPIRLSRHLFLVAAILRYGWAAFLMAGFNGTSTAAEDSGHIRPEYFNIKDLSFVSENLSPRTIIFSGYSLRDSLRKVVENENWSCWIDSEIDGTRQVEIRATRCTTTEALRQLAQDTGLGMMRIDTIIFVSRSEITPIVATSAALRRLELRAKMVRWPDDQQQAWKSRHSLKWDDLTTMAELTAKAEKLWGVRIDGELPHDLLPAGQLTNVLLADALSVMAANSFQTFEVSSSGESCRFRPIQPEDQTIPVHFPDISREKLNVLAATVPQVKIMDHQTLALVSGTEPALRQLYWLTRGKPEPSIRPTNPAVSRPTERLTTAVEQGGGTGKRSSKKKTADDPTGFDPAKLKITLKSTQATRLAVLEQLSRNGMTIEFSEKEFMAHGLPLDQKVEVVADNVPLDEFIKSLFPSGKVLLQVEAKKLILSPALAQP